MGERRNSINIVIEGFRNSGYIIEEVPANSVTRVATVKGQLISCIDPRRDDKTEPNQLGPAVPGGVIGLAFLMEDSKRAIGILARLDRAIIRVQESGYVPSVHGDHVNGKVHGCKLLYALTQRVLPGDGLSEEEILEAVASNGIEHPLLNGGASPIGLAVNFESNTTIIQKRKKYSADIWYLDELGLNPVNYTPKLIFVTNQLLHGPNRRLIVPAAA